MLRTAALLLAVAVGVSLAAGTAQADSPVNIAARPQAKPTTAEQGDDPLPDGCAMRFGTSRFRHGIPISMLAVSETGNVAVAVNGNHMLGCTRAFSLDSGREIFRLDGYEALDIDAAAISPDGKTIVTKQDFTLRFRVADTGHELRKVDLPRVVNGSFSRNEWLAFTPDGKSIVVTSQGKDIHLMDIERGEIVRSFANEDADSSVSVGWGSVLGIAISSDGKLLASGGFNNEKDNYFARLWDIETGKELRRFMHGRSYGIESLAFSPDGKTLATGAHDARLRLFEVESGKQLRKFPKNGASRMHAGCVAFSSDGKTVATAGQSLRLYDVASGAERWHLDRRALGLLFTDGGKTLTGAVMGAICRWDAATGAPLTPEAGDSPVEQIITSADGTRMLTRGTDGDAHLWDTATGKHLRYIGATSQHSVAMSPDARYVAWAVADASAHFSDPLFPNLSFDGAKIRLYDVTADKFIDGFPAFKGDAIALTFINDGKTLVTVDYRDGGVRIWNVETGKEERSFKALREEELKLSNPVWRSELSADGKTLAVAYVLRNGGNVDNLGFGGGGESYPIRVWDVITGKELHQFESTNARYIRNLAFSPDGKWLVSSGSALDQIPSGTKLAIWNVATGETEASVPARACAVAFSGDGHLLATTDPEGAIQVWDTATWTLRQEYTSGGHRDRPTAIAFSTDSQFVCSGSLDTTVLAWRIPPAGRAP